jgi:hypothetical protein
VPTAARGGPAPSSEIAGRLLNSSTDPTRCRPAITQTPPVPVATMSPWKAASGRRRRDWLLGQDAIPILDHPERHGFFAAVAGSLVAPAVAGTWIQVTIDSLLGSHFNCPVRGIRLHDVGPWIKLRLLRDKIVDCRVSSRKA